MITDEKAAASLPGTREKLILAGLAELQLYGISGFSTRRVAKACGLSCAAPYKHFENTQEFISEILGYINHLYQEEQAQLLRQYAGCSSTQRLLEISMHYVEFLVKHPDFRRVIMINYRDCKEEYRVLRGQLSTTTYQIVGEYCRDLQLDESERAARTYVVRSLIYGAALFFENGEMEYNEATISMVRAQIARVLQR